MRTITRRGALALGPFALSPLALTLAAPPVAHVEPTWPARTVRFVVPFPPGQAADIFARLMAERLTQMWKQQVMVDNKGGGGGIPGVEAARAAAPDGYTFLVATAACSASIPASIPTCPTSR